MQYKEQSRGRTIRTCRATPLFHISTNNKPSEYFINTEREIPGNFLYWTYINCSLHAWFCTSAFYGSICITKFGCDGVRYLFCITWFHFERFVSTKTSSHFQSNFIKVWTTTTSISFNQYTLIPNLHYHISYYTPSPKYTNNINYILVITQSWF